MIEPRTLCMLGKGSTIEHHLPTLSLNILTSSSSEATESQQLIWTLFAIPAWNIYWLDIPKGVQVLRISPGNWIAFCNRWRVKPGQRVSFGSLLLWDSVTVCSVKCASIFSSQFFIAHKVYVIKFFKWWEVQFITLKGSMFQYDYWVSLTQFEVLSQ